jgi:hypothetical protein
MPNEKDKIVAEIHTLIDEQMESLKGRLTSSEAVQYADCRRRIDDLLTRISHNAFRAD